MKTVCLQFALLCATLSHEASCLEIGSWRLQPAEAANADSANFSSLSTKIAEHGKAFEEGTSNITRLSHLSQKVRSLSAKLCFPLASLWGVGAPGARATSRRDQLDAVHGHNSLSSSGKSVGVEDEDESTDMGPYIISWLATEFVYLALCMVVAYFYKSHKDWFLGQEIKEASQKDFTRWTSPFLEPILFWSCICPGVRWADSMSMSGVLPGFWQGFLLFFLMCVITGLSLGLPGWILMTCFLTFFRMRLRTKFQMESSLCFDFCGYCWCMPCLVAQEARHVEDAQQAHALPA